MAKKDPACSWRTVGALTPPRSWMTTTNYSSNKEGLTDYRRGLTQTRHSRNWILTRGWAPPIARPSKIVCVGLNYALHAKESGMDPPPEPVLFFKASSAICGPYDDLIIPGNKTDWEVELAVVIGKRASYVSAEQAPNYIAGYVLLNDYSERESQLERGGQWVKGKSFDTFAPLGPFLATADEIPDPNNLKLWLSVNGTMLQNSTTADFIVDVWEVISYTSHFMTLLPGDVISTGTPAGVGLGLNPQRYLKPGDVVELGIEGLGKARQVARERHL